MALVMAAMQMVTRMRDHIERLDDGTAYAADDLAVVLRALLCPGNGNQVLKRLYDSNGFAIPTFLVSSPAEDGPEVFFSVGAVPTYWEEAAADGAATCTLSEWLNKRVLIVTSAGSRKSYSWSQFLNTYANKWGGAHLDPTIPPHLQMIDNQAASGMPLSHYLLRSAGVQAWELSQHLFRQALCNYEPPGWDAEALAQRQRDWSEHPNGAILVAGGGNSTEPRDISAKGLLQHFTHRTDGAHVTWYVDESSSDNSLHLQLGTVPYDVRYQHPSVPSTEGPIEISAQRHPLASQPIDLDASKQISVTGQIRALNRMRRVAAE